MKRRYEIANFERFKDSIRQLLHVLSVYLRHVVFNRSINQNQLVDLLNIQTHHKICKNDCLRENPRIWI